MWFFRISLLLLALPLLLSCGREEGPVSPPLKVVSLLDSAEPEGAAAIIAESTPAEWRLVLHENFDDGLAEAWQAAPGFRVPIQAEAGGNWLLQKN